MTPMRGRLRKDQNLHLTTTARCASVEVEGFPSGGGRVTTSGQQGGELHYIAPRLLACYVCMKNANKKKHTKNSHQAGHILPRDTGMYASREQKCRRKGWPQEHGARAQQPERLQQPTLASTLKPSHQRPLVRKAGWCHYYRGRRREQLSRRS